MTIANWVSLYLAVGFALASITMILVWKGRERMALWAFCLIAVGWLLAVPWLLIRAIRRRFVTERWR